MNLHLPVAVAATALLLSACASGTSDEAADPSPPTSRAAATTGSTTTTATPVSATRSDRDAETLVHDPAATLERVKITRDGTAYDVTALWRVPSASDEAFVVAHSTDGFATGSYREVDQAEGLAAVSSNPADAPEPGSCSSVVPAGAVCVDVQGQVGWTVDGGPLTTGTTGLEDLLQDPVDSLDPDVLATIGSGDGATLSGFEKAARSIDGGASWSTVDLPEFDGHRGFYTGAIVLPDGRLLSLIPGFDDDALGSDGAPPVPADRFHGLYVSDGDDWSTAESTLAEFSPALPVDAPDEELTQITALGTGTGGDPVVWVEAAGRLYVTTATVSTDVEVSTPFVQVAAR